MTRIVGLQGHGDHAADLLLHDAHLPLEALVELGVADQQRFFLLENAVANGLGDFEAFAAGGADFEIGALERHQHAAAGHDGFDREIHDHFEQLSERAVFGKLAAGANQRAHLRAALHDGGLIEIVGLRARARASRLATTVVAVLEKLSSLVDEDHGVRERARDVGEFDGEMAGGDAVAGAERRRRFEVLAVEQSAVLAAPDPRRATAVARGSRTGQVLAREAGVVGITQLVGAGAAERDAVAVERDRNGLSRRNRG